MIHPTYHFGSSGNKRWKLPNDAAEPLLDVADEKGGCGRMNLCDSWEAGHVGREERGNLQRSDV